MKTEEFTRASGEDLEAGWNIKTAELQKLADAYVNVFGEQGFDIETLQSLIFILAAYGYVRIALDVPERERYKEMDTVIQEASFTTPIKTLPNQ